MPPGCNAPIPLRCKEELCMHEHDGLGHCVKFAQEPCVNQCNQRGVCVTQTCHCHPGYYGADCSLSLDSAGTPTILEGLGYSLNPKGPRVYIYELPSNLTTWRVLWVDRSLHAIVWERILSEGLRVADPNDADYFFVQGPLRGCSRADAIQAYLLEHYARWVTRHGGRDHIMTAAGDWGRLEGHNGAWLPHNSTMLQFWGLAAESETRGGDSHKQAYFPGQVRGGPAPWFPCCRRRPPERCQSVAHGACVGSPLFPVLAPMDPLRPRVQRAAAGARHGWRSRHAATSTDTAVRCWQGPGRPARCCCLTVGCA
ncbi:MAG: hypothetical protein WDW38_007627 [Sanguina aurantia]